VDYVKFKVLRINIFSITAEVDRSYNNTLVTIFFFSKQ